MKMQQIYEKLDWYQPQRRPATTCEISNRAKKAVSIVLSKEERIDNVAFLLDCTPFQLEQMMNTDEHWTINVCEMAIQRLNIRRDWIYSGVLPIFNP